MFHGMEPDAVVEKTSTLVTCFWCERLHAGVQALPHIGIRAPDVEHAESIAVHVSQRVVAR